MPVDNRTMQPDRILHGGASVALAETLGSVGGSMCVDRERFQIVGQEINANHLRPATGGQVTDNLAIGPNDVDSFTLTAPSDPRLPGSGGQTIGPLYNTNPTVFGQLNQLIVPTGKIGDDTRVFNGVDVNINVRGAHGFTFQGGTSTGKVTDDWCEIRAAVPESYLLNPYCRNESPFLTAFRALATYTIPKIDVNLSTVLQDKPNIGTDQIVSLQATYTLTTPATAPAGTDVRNR